jgi:glycosyltransferase involved in cell wall biosynthesis
MPQSLSAVIITKNEEKRIAATVKALQWCNEIVVVDSGSTDNTVDICKQLGCVVYHHAFENYGKQKNYAVSLAKNNWVLVVDADEIITAELAEEIKQILNSDAVPYHGYKIKISLVFLGRLLRFGGEYNMNHLRFFNKQHGQYNSDDVHEDVVIDGKSPVLKNRMLHYSYENLHDYFEKFNQYTSLAAEKMKGKKPKSKLYLFLKFPLTFLQTYFLKGLIFDGYPGFMWAMLGSFYPLVKYAKHREINL